MRLPERKREESQHLETLGHVPQGDLRRSWGQVPYLWEDETLLFTPISQMRRLNLSEVRGLVRPIRTPGGRQQTLGAAPAPALCVLTSEQQSLLICIALAERGCESAWGAILWVREVGAQERRTVPAGFFTSAW